ncbi:enoyl-CoA hydratase/isomerase family protein [Streptomyces iconiensis]|uniref:Enoyl-CoA hydratase/isomerase family protein n=1 Tax=Streptomyces iconiensis TaxID=1384038 RepID=A0ABT7A5P8_9ACTN|nr:enoyl-CoA hydratase/isomerase family protein [Streptomyces iconiensis]MDJ1136344.1 enoyl-CoA hydratase/isomerase family protein [Streptomyces iconiensis]
MTAGQVEYPHPHLAVQDHPAHPVHPAHAVHMVGDGGGSRGGSGSAGGEEGGDRDDDRGTVRVLRIDREDKLGALSGELVAALGEQIVRVRQDRGVRAVVLTGTGRGFIAGADVGEYSGASTDAFMEYQRRSRQVFDSLERLPQPSVAAVNGYAFGGGFEIALCCDFIVASRRARFALPEVTLGLIPGGGGTQRLARAAGTRFAKELVMTGRRVSADEAARRGLVTEVAEPEELTARALAFAALLATRAPLAVREAKRVIDGGVGQALDAALTAEQSALGGLFGSADGQEGIAAFMEKRAPRFKGA